MSKNDILKVLTYIGVNFTDFRKRLKDETDCKMIIDLWYDCFKDVPYEVFANAVKKTLLTCKYPPTIAEVRENCFLDNRIQPIDLWTTAYKMLSNGIYMTKEEFEKYPIECQRFFGDTVLLKKMSIDEDLNLDVVRSNFYKQVEVIQNREKKDNIIPKQLQDTILKLSEKFEYKEE